MPRILIAGYHGFGNCGDEAILLAMKSNISALYGDALITALSFAPEETERVYGIKSENRFKPLRVFSAIAKTDVLILGGGSLLQDETSLRSLLYYLAIIFCAKLLGKKAMLYSNGIGPVSKKISKILIKIIVNRVDLITLREQSSMDELRRLGVTKPPIYVTADPAFTLKGVDKEAAWELLEREGIPKSTPLVGVSVRPWKESEAFSGKIAALCDYIVEKYNAEILFIPMQRGPDTKISGEIMGNMKKDAHILRKTYSSDEILGIIGVLDIILSMRLHSLVFAAARNIPMLGFVYDPKIESFLELLAAPSAGDVNNLDFELLKMRVDDLFENNLKHRAILKEKADSLKEKSKLNDELLKALLEASSVEEMNNEWKN